jgi:hypothetical protein
MQTRKLETWPERKARVRREFAVLGVQLVEFLALAIPVALLVAVARACDP